MATLLPNDDVSDDELEGYRIFLFSHDHPHPPHVHFGKGKRVGAWDLTTGACTDGDGFSSSEVRQQGRILGEFREAIWRSWNAHWERQQ